MPCRFSKAVSLLATSMQDDKDSVFEQILGEKYLMTLQKQLALLKALFRKFKSDKYKVLEEERLSRLHEVTKEGSQYRKFRAKELSKETNRRRRALDERKKQREVEEAQEREAALAERRRQQQEATNKFQKGALNRKRSSRSDVNGTANNQDPAFPLQDGIHIVQGHVVEIKDGQRILRMTPELDVALNLVWGAPAPAGVEQGNKPVTGVVQGQDGQRLWQAGHYLESPPLDSMEGVFLANGSVRHHSGKVNTSQASALGGYSLLSFSSHEQTELNDLARIAEHERLRQEAISKGGPKLAFMKDTNEQELTEGALPTTMGRDSPAGSLTSLDSLDEVPESESVSKGTLMDKAKVSGIIAKNAKGKSSVKRRVTFSDSIEFDDGVVGQLVTHQNQSTKYFAALYAANLAENEHGVSSDAHMVHASRHGSRFEVRATVALKENASERQDAVSRSQNKNSTTNSAAHNPARVGASLPPQSFEKSSAESPGSSVTHSNKPNASASSANADLASGRSAGSTGSTAQPAVRTRNRGCDWQPPEDELSCHMYSSLQDSLDMVRDSLDDKSPEEGVGDYARSILGGRGQGQDVDPYSPAASQYEKEESAEEVAQAGAEKTEDEDLRNEGSSPVVTYYSNPFFHPAVSSGTVSSKPSTQAYMRGYIPTSTSAPKSFSTQHASSVAQDYSPTAFSSVHSSPVATTVFSAPQKSFIPLSGFSAVTNAPQSSPVGATTGFSSTQNSFVPLSGFSVVSNAHQSSAMATDAFSVPQNIFNSPTLAAFSGPSAGVTPTTAAANGPSSHGNPLLHNKGTRYQGNTDTACGSAQAKVEMHPGSDVNSVKNNSQYPIRSFPSQKYSPVVSDQGNSSKPSLALSGGVVSNQTAVNQNSVRNAGPSNSPIENSVSRKTQNQAAVKNSKVSSVESKPPSQATAARNKPKVLKRTSEVRSSKSASSQRRTGVKRGGNENRSNAPVGFSNVDKSSVGKQQNRTQSGRTNAGDMDSPSPSDEDDLINSIKWNMDKINMRARSDAARTQHQKLMESLNVDFDSGSAGWQEKEPILTDALDTGEHLENGLEPPRPAQSRVGSATRRLHHPTPGRSLPSESRQAVGSASLKSSNPRANSGRNLVSHANQVYSSPKIEDPRGESVFRTDYVGSHGGVSGGAYFSSHSNISSNLSSRTSAPQFSEPPHRTSKAYGTMLVNPNAEETGYVSVRENAFEQPNTHLKRSMALDRTPTDEEINFLWERVRTCLGTKTKQTAGSDSCVDTIHARRSRTHSGPISRQVFQPSGSITRNSPLEESYLAQNTTFVGGSTIGGLRRYGSHEVLRRNDSSDSFGLRRPVLLQQRAQKSRQSQQGKPPLPRQHNQNFSPVHSRGTPSSITSKGPQPLSAHEMRAVMKASEQTQEMLQRNQQDYTPEQQYQHAHHLLGARKAPSALSLEEQRLMESLDRLNERLKVQEAVTSKLSQHKMNSRVAHKPPTGHNRTGGHPRTSSASRATRNPQVTVPAPRNYSSSR